MVNTTMRQLPKPLEIAHTLEDGIAVVRLAGRVMLGDERLVKPKERLITADKIRSDDAIVILESSGIHANGLTLARKIADARRDARQGDIFTHEVSERFRKIIRRAFHGPEGRRARRTIQQDTPFKVIALRVNDVYPENIPLTTTPPTLLLKLPVLPPELAYRFVGHDLALKDIKTGLIVDLIPNAIR